MYLRVPTGDLVEVDDPDVDALDRSAYDAVVERETTGPAASIYDDIQLPQ